MKIRDIGVFILCASMVTSSLAMASNASTEQVTSPPAAEFVIQVKNDQGMTADQYTKNLEGNIQDMKDEVANSVFELKTATGAERLGTAQHLINSMGTQRIYEKELVSFQKTGVAMTKSDLTAQLGQVSKDAFSRTDIGQLEPGIQALIKQQDNQNPGQVNHPASVKFQKYSDELLKGKGVDWVEPGAKGPVSGIDAHAKLTIASKDLVNQNEVGNLFRNTLNMIRAQDGQAQQVDAGPTLG